MLLTDGLSLSEGEVGEAVPGLGPDGVEEVEEDALAVSARQELVRILDVDEVCSWQNIIIIVSQVSRSRKIYPVLTHPR